MIDTSVSPIKQSELNKPNKVTLSQWAFNKRFGSMETEGMKWVPTWKELSTWQHPTRGIFNDVPNKPSSKINYQIVIDSYARRCIRDFASGMLTGMTSPVRPWFELGIEDQDLQEYLPVKRYLDDCANILHSLFGKSNVYDCLYITYEEIATFGTAAMFLGEDYIDGIRGRAFTIGEYYLGVGSDGRVNAFARKFYMTVGQMVSEFGLEACSKNVRNLYSNHSVDQWIQVNLLIEENDRRIKEYRDWRNMSYRSVYFEQGSEDGVYLRMEGFEDFPILAPRWSTTTSFDIYGISAGWDTLGDVRMLQKEQTEKLLGIAKKTNPPMQADSSVQNVNTLPGGLTRSSSQLPNAGIRQAYQVDLDLSAIREDIKEIKLALDDAYHRDLFRMMIGINRSGVTAMEIAEKQAERLNLASPVILRLTNELNNPLIANAFRIANNLGLLPPPPKEIQGRELKIHYISTLAQAQRMIGVNSIVNNINFGIGLAGAFPEVLDNYNIDQTAKEHSRAIGVPGKTMSSPEEIAYKRKVRADAAAANAKLTQMGMMGELAPKISKAMKDAGTTPLGKGSALDKIAGLAPGAK